MARSTQPAVLYVLLAFILVPSVIADNWPMEGHDLQRTSASSERLTGELTPLWSFNINAAVETSPAIVDGIVYVVAASYLGSNFLNSSIYAIDAQTGATLWSYDVGGHVEGSPIVVDGTVYVPTSKNRVLALDAKKGELRQTYTAAEPKESAAIDMDTSPALVNGTLYFGSDEGVLYAVDTRTGAEVWGFDAAIKPRVEPKPGEGVWVQKASAPTVAEGLVFLGSGTRDAETVNGTHFHALDQVTGKERWSFACKWGVVAPPIVSDGVAYFGAMDNEVYALDAMTGEKRWTFHTHGPISRSPALSEGVLYISSADGRLYALDK